MKQTIKLFFGLIVFLLPCSISAQTLSLDDCRQKAMNNYPLINQYKLTQLSEQYTLENANKRYLPQISLNAQATYQTDVTEIPFDLEGLPIQIDIPTLDKDQYRATLDVSQVIWDGGVTHSQKEVIREQGKAEQKQLDVEMYAIRNQVNQLFFGILIIDEQLAMAGLLQKELKVNYKTIESMLNNGVVMPSDLDIIRVEMLNTEQRIMELNSMRKGYLKMLSLFIHEPLTDAVVLQKPANTDWQNLQRLRPELQLFDIRRSMLDAQTKTVNARNRPQLGLFVQGGYGRPGLDMFAQKFKLYALGGIRLSWNFGNLYTRGNELKTINQQLQSIDVQENTFLFNTNLQLAEKQEEINKYKSLMEKDDEIIQLRNRVKQASESKYRNGILPVNELIRDITAESQARQTKAIHEIQYLLSIENYKHIQGNQP